MLSREVAAHVRTVARSVYWRQEQASVIVAALNDSGMTLTDFARHFDIKPQRIRRWMSRLDQPAPTPIAQLQPSINTNTLPAPTFHPVQLVHTDSSMDPALELVLANGRRVKVSPGFDSHTLTRLLHLAESLPC